MSFPTLSAKTIVDTLNGLKGKSHFSNSVATKSIGQRLDEIILKYKSPNPTPSKADYFQIASDIGLWDLPIVELVELYALINVGNFKGIPPTVDIELRKIIFEIRDQILRLASNNAAIYANAMLLCATHPILKKDLSRLKPDCSLFIPLAELTNAAAKGVLQDNRPKHKSKSPISLHVTVEYEKAMVGGVGGVAQSLLLKMNEAKLDARIVTPFYDVYKGDESFKSATFIGLLEHEFDSKMIKSSIYKVWGNGNVAHYVIKPDPSMLQLFDINTAGNVYATVGNSSLDERALYLASAIAAMGGTYRGRKSNKQFDIVHFHTWTSTLGAHIIKNKYSPLRSKAHLNPVHPVQHFHHGSLAEQTVRSAEIYKKLCLTDIPKKVSQCNTQQDIWLHADGIAFVSPTNAANSVNPKTGEGLHEVAQHLYENGRLTAVMNGIDWKAHSLTNGQAHGSFAIKQVFSDGKDITDYVGNKQKIKKALFDAGFVGDPKKPLFLYVGRFSPEKGIDKLEGMAEEIIRSGGQCVIMGWGEGGHVPSEIQSLKKMAEKNPGTLRVYTTPAEQKEIFKNSGVSKGNLIRGATDFLLMPSKFEGCALVVWEALARGCPIISSMGGGLKAQCFDLNEVGEEKFNAFGYRNDENAKQDAAQAIQRSIAFYKEKIKKPTQWNNIVGRLFRESEKNDWLVKEGPIEQLSKFYEKIMRSPSPQEVQKRQKLVEAYYKKYSKTRLGIAKSKIRDAFSKVLNWTNNKIKVLAVSIFNSLKNLNQTILESK